MKKFNLTPMFYEKWYCQKTCLHAQLTVYSYVQINTTLDNISHSRGLQTYVSITDLHVLYTVYYQTQKNWQLIVSKMRCKEKKIIIVPTQASVI
jgi:hypothetical protein